MILYINQDGEVRDVGATTDATLTPVEVTAESGYFVGWSAAKICCHKVTVESGKVTGFTPCVDPKIIEHIDRLGAGHEVNASDVTDIQLAMVELHKMLLETKTALEEVGNA